MGEDQAKDRLLEFLNERVFDPVLTASAYNHDADDEARRIVRDVQSAMRILKASYYRSTSSRDVVESFRSDMHSGVVQRVDSTLHDLGLPALSDVEQEFLQLAQRLGVPE